MERERASPDDDSRCDLRETKPWAAAKGLPVVPLTHTNLHICPQRRSPPNDNLPAVQVSLSYSPEMNVWSKSTLVCFFSQLIHKVQPLTIHLCIAIPLDWNRILMVSLRGRRAPLICLLQFPLHD